MQKFNGSLIRQFLSLTTGNAASGVQVSVFISGTNTLATLYATNNIAGAQLGNPLTTDGKGFYSFYAADGRYRLEFNNGFPSLEIQLVDVIDINAEFNAAISGLENTIDTLTLTVAGDFDTGANVTARNQVVLWPTSAGGDGREYRWAGALPKTVPAASTPDGTGGISDSAWVYTANTALEQAIGAPDGSGLIAGQQASKYFATFNTVAEMQAAITADYVGRRVQWLGYHALSDGGSGWGVVKSGAHVADGGSIITAGPSLYVEQNLKGNKISTRKFGAKIDSNFNASNSPTDDTAAVQALIDFLDGDEYSVLYSPSGFCMVTQLVAKAGIKIKGDGAGISYFIQPVGETQSILTDNGTAANLFIEDVAFDCNNNTIPNAAVYLGYGGQQMGVVAGFRQVFVRNVDGNGVSINGNVIVVDWLETYFCTGTGVIIDGEGNKYNKIITSNCGTIGIHIKGSSNEVYNSHYETACATACCLVGANTVGNVVNGVKITGVGGNIHGAGVKIETNASNFSIRDVRASVTSSANVANGLIYDLSGGTRRIWGLDTGGVSFLVPDYTGGSRVQLPYKSSTPPTAGTHRQGDWFTSGVGAEGFPTGWICSAGGTPGTFSPMETNAGAINKAANETLAATDIGKRFKNETAAGVITLTLPAVEIGSRIHFTRRNGTHALQIDPNGSQLIRPGGAGKYLSLDTDGASVTLEYMSANSWCIVAQSGTVSFEP